MEFQQINNMIGGDSYKRWQENNIILSTINKMVTTLQTLRLNMILRC